MLLIALVAIPVLLLSILSPSVSSALRLVMLLASGFFLVWLARATRAALSKSYNGYRVVVVEILTNVPKRQSELPPTPEQIGRQSVLKALKGK